MIDLVDRLSGQERGVELEPIPENLQGVIINDCDDPNARVRQQVKFEALFGITPKFVELGTNNADLEAAGHLVDVLDAQTVPSGLKQRSRSVILVNVAPRGDDVRKHYENGTPFCRANVGSNVVLSTFEGRALSLVKKLGLVGKVDLYDIPTVTQRMTDIGWLDQEEAQAIQNSQFRSLEFLPLAARAVANGTLLPASEEVLPDHPKVDSRAWFIDRFGNIKTTILPEEVEFEAGRTARIVPGQEITMHERLADVPTGQFGLTRGSSGYGRHKWLEVVRQRGNASEVLHIQAGDEVPIRRF